MNTSKTGQLEQSPNEATKVQKEAWHKPELKILSVSQDTLLQQGPLIDADGFEHEPES